MGGSRWMRAIVSFLSKSKFLVIFLKTDRLLKLSGSICQKDVHEESMNIIYRAALYKHVIKFEIFSASPSGAEINNLSATNLLKLGKKHGQLSILAKTVVTHFVPLLREVIEIMPSAHVVCDYVMK